MQYPQKLHRPGKVACGICWAFGRLQRWLAVILQLTVHRNDCKGRLTNDVSSFFGHVNQVTTRPCRKFNSIDDTLLQTVNSARTSSIVGKRHTGPTISATWLTLVPLAAPRYRTLAPGLIKISSSPPNTPAANLLRNGFQTRYSVFVPSTPLSIDIRFSPYTDSPGTRFLVTNICSLPLAINTPGCL